MPEAKRRILCAESWKDVSDLIALLLEQKGYEVRTARTVAEALTLAQAEAFDLYILNDTYVDGDSFELMKELRALTPATPLLLFSLDGSGHGRERAEKTGARYYVTKMSDFTALVQTIDGFFQAQ